MNYRYDKDLHVIKGIPEKEKPVYDKKLAEKYGNIEYDNIFEVRKGRYEQHIAYLPSYPLPTDIVAPGWWPEELEEGKHFNLGWNGEEYYEAIPLPELTQEEKNLEKEIFLAKEVTRIYEERKTAGEEPEKQESEDDLWKEVRKLVACVPMNLIDSQFDTIKIKYSITRKK